MTTHPHAKKSLGQHFLHNEGACQRIVALAQLKPTDAVLEIGPGPGALTKHLLAIPPRQYLLIEKDDHWATHHAAQCTAYGEVLHADALTFPWTSLQGAWTIVGNLPYNVASPLIWDIVSQTPELSRAVFMIQKEVGQRLAAKPGGRDYGALSVWVQSYVAVHWGFVVGPGSFSPPPKVDSAVVSFTPLTEKPLCSPKALQKILKICFQQRRKQLQSILRKAGFSQTLDVLNALGIAPEARPETLTTKTFQQLAKKLFEE